MFGSSLMQCGPCGHVVHAKPVINYAEPFIKSQNYKTLKNLWSADHLFSNGSLFEDDVFPAEAKSISITDENLTRNIVWKRPKELVDNPQFCVAGCSRFDAIQGRLGNCWFIAAAANLTLHQEFYATVVPSDQGFGYGYSGIFHFRFWQYGEWVDVVVDDKLPVRRVKTKEGKITYELVFVKSKHGNEFWCPLLEKAYAKLHGSYAALASGGTCEALMDFTGGITERFYTDNCTGLENIMLNAYNNKTIICCDTPSDGCGVEVETLFGLVNGHAYSITEVKYVVIDLQTHCACVVMLKIRNPWGECAWNGRFSRGSREWGLLPEKDRNSLGDGESFMWYDDFIKHFRSVTICYLDPKAMTPNLCERGCDVSYSAYNDSYLVFPQNQSQSNFAYGWNQKAQIDLPLEKNTIVVSLSQKNERGEGKTFKALKFKVTNANGQDVMQSSYVRGRDVTHRFELPRGTYYIYPYFEDGANTNFILRVFEIRPAPPPPPQPDQCVQQSSSELSFGEILFGGLLAGGALLGLIWACTPDSRPRRNNNREFN